MKKVFEKASCLLCLIMAVVMFLGGCGGGGDGESSAETPIQACELFTQQQIETIFGAQVDASPVSTHKVDEKNGFWMSMCNYFSPDTNLSAGFMIQPIAKGQTIEDAFSSYKKSIEKSLPDYIMDQVQGVGSRAVWNEEMMQLTVFEGSHMIIITGGLKNWSTEEKISFARKLGLAVLEKI